MMKANFALVTFLCIVTASAVFQGCAHNYFYLPESQDLKSQGNTPSQDAKTGLIYIVPSAGPAEFMVRVRSLGVHKTRHLQMLGMRMSFSRPVITIGTPQAIPPEIEISINPAEQIIRIADGEDIKAAYVHSKTKDHLVVKLSGTASEAVEFFYPLPTELEGAENLSSYTFHWKLQYDRNKIEQQVVRFKRHDGSPHELNTANPDDIIFPFASPPVDDPGMTSLGPFWWTADPMWPWW